MVNKINLGKMTKVKTCLASAMTRKPYKQMGSMPTKISIFLVAQKILVSKNNNYT